METGSTHGKLSICILTVIVICFFGADLVGCTAVVQRKGRSDSECYVSQYNKNGELLKASVPCNSAMDHVFTSQYLPDIDIYDPNVNGMKIFKPFPNSCFKSHDLLETATSVSKFKDTKLFYPQNRIRDVGRHVCCWSIYNGNNVE